MPLFLYRGVIKVILSAIIKYVDEDEVTNASFVVHFEFDNFRIYAIPLVKEYLYYTSVSYNSAFSP